MQIKNVYFSYRQNFGLTRLKPIRVIVGPDPTWTKDKKSLCTVGSSINYIMLIWLKVNPLGNTSTDPLPSSS